MIIQIIDHEDKSKRYIDGVRHVRIGEFSGDEDMPDPGPDLFVRGSNEPNGGTCINCHLGPKYGDREYIIYLIGGAVAWLLNDEGKTLSKIV